jgi:hypothetical protein
MVANYDRTVHPDLDASSIRMLNEALMDRRSKTCPEAQREMTFRKRARTSHLLDRDISFKMRAQHLLGSKLLPRLQPRLVRLRTSARRNAPAKCERRAPCNLVEGQPIERPAVADKSKNALCHCATTRSSIKNASRRRNDVETPLSSALFSSILEKGNSASNRTARHLHFHAAIQIDKRGAERYRSRDPNLLTVVKGLPLTNC